jgi:hypothetical protein
MKHGTIRQLLILGIGAVLCAFILLGAGWMVSISHLGEMKTRLLTDAQSLQHAQTLEMNVLAVARNRKKELSDDEAIRLLAELKKGVTSPQEQRIVATLEKRYREWNAAPQKATINAFIEAIRNHRHLNTQQMQQTMQAGNLLEARVRLWTPALIALSAGAIGIGGWKLWAKIFGPHWRWLRQPNHLDVATSRTRAGAGKRRMNDLCRTFNSMADAIRDRESDRLTFCGDGGARPEEPVWFLSAGRLNLLHRPRRCRPTNTRSGCRIARNTDKWKALSPGFWTGYKA